MENYEWILFDADETLFHFDAFAGLRHMFANYNIEFSAKDYQHYQNINKGLWDQYQNHEINASQVKQQRFQYWADKLDTCPHELNQAFLDSMALICKTIDGADALLENLYDKAKLGIITNGFSALQEVRLEKTGLKKYFDLVVVSEEVGVAKPHPDIFNHAISNMGNPLRKNVLMVGDNLHSDIIGGNQAGFDTCWFNPTKQPQHNTIRPTYQVQSHEQLNKLLTVKL